MQTELLLRNNNSQGFYVAKKSNVIKTLELIRSFAPDLAETQSFHFLANKSYNYGGHYLPGKNILI